MVAQIHELLEELGDSLDQLLCPNTNYISKFIYTQFLPLQHTCRDLCTLPPTRDSGPSLHGERPEEHRHGLVLHEPDSPHSGHLFCYLYISTHRSNKNGQSPHMLYSLNSHRWGVTARDFC